MKLIAFAKFRCFIEVCLILFHRWAWRLIRLISSHRMFLDLFLHRLPHCKLGFILLLWLFLFLYILSILWIIILKSRSNYAFLHLTSIATFCFILRNILLSLHVPFDIVSDMCAEASSSFLIRCLVLLFLQKSISKSLLKVLDERSSRLFLFSSLLIVWVV